MPTDLSQLAGSPLELAFALRLVVAMILGAVMGIERSLSGKHAGMRTYALVSLGACLFVVCSTLASLQLSFFSSINPLLIASAIVTGIGFIGAGLAGFGGNHPAELTTATGLWVSAGIGMACGFGLYTIAVSSVVVALVIFTVFAPLEHALRVRFGKDGE